MIDVRSDWLAYARRVVRDEAHQAACANLGGSPAGSGYEPDLRWPGMLGADYEPGGVLWVSNVHRNFDSGLMPSADVDRLVAATREWKRGALGDDAFLAASQTGYAMGLRSWTVGWPIRKFCSLAGLSVEQLVYANAARCQTHDAGRRLQRLCLAWLPLSVLVDAVKPRLVVLTSSVALGWPGTLPGSPLVVGVNQRNGLVMPSSSPWQVSGLRAAGLDAWVPAALAVAGIRP